MPKISRTALMHIVGYWMNKMVAETDISAIEQINLDETSLKQGQIYMKVVGDPVRRQVIGVENRRDVDAVERVLEWSTL